MTAPKRLKRRAAAPSPYKKAIKDIDELIRRNPHSPHSADAHNIRGVAYAGLGQHEKAIKDFDEALCLDPKLAAAYHKKYGITREDLKKGKATAEKWAAALPHRRSIRTPRRGK